MSDETKAAMEWLRSLQVPGWPAMDHCEAILAHIDGEPGRIAAAEQRAREEQACVLRDLLTDPATTWDSMAELGELISAAPLTATPLADALRAAEEGVRYWTAQAQHEANEAAQARARVAELERDVLVLTGPVTPEMLNRLSDVQGYVRTGEPLSSADLREAVAALRDARVPAQAEALRRYDGLRDDESVERLARIDAVLAKHPEEP